MGAILSTDLDVDLYKWSSTEFPQEYAIHYTSVQSESKESSIFWLSVNRDKVLCRVADYLSKSKPVRLHMLVTTVRDNNTGKLRFGEVKVVSDGAIDEHTLTRNDAVNYKYGLSSNRPVSHFTVNRRDQNAGAESNKTTWEVCHSYLISAIRTKLKSYVQIQCNEETGLSVEFSGPHKYKGFVFEDQLDSPIQRVVNGEPPKAVKAIVESEFKGEAFTLFPREKANMISVPVSVQATGLVCTIGAQIQGNGNGSVYYNCQFYPSSMGGRLGDALNHL